MSQPLPPARRSATPHPFDAAWIADGRADAEAAEATLADLDLPDPAPQPAAQPAVDRIVSLVARLDLTSLNGDDTPETIRTLCRRARSPFGDHAAAAPPTVAAICIHPFFLDVARPQLDGTSVRVAVVAGGFPFGLSSLHQRAAEVEECAARGADEIDTVINRSLALTGEWERLYEELIALRHAAGDAILKVILATGELRTLQNVALAARTALLAGADFVKTSTGKEAVNATLPAGLVMLRALRAHQQRTGHLRGFKAAGGIRTVDQGLRWLRLVTEVLGEDNSGADHFRIGASGLLDDILTRVRGGDSPPHERDAGY